MTANEKIPKLRNHLLTGFAVILILGLVWLLQLPTVPGQRPLAIDSGFFAYAGRQILGGAELYTDIFDTKSPGIYYVNALALTLFGDSLWSIWLFQGIWTTATVLVFFHLLRGYLHTASALLGTLFFLLTLYYPDFYLSGNLTETYALLPQVLGLFAVAAYDRSGKRGWLLLLGAAAGAAMLFKPTYFAVGLAGGAAVILRELSGRRWRDAAGHAGLILLGLLLPLLITGSCLLSNGTLQGFWDSVILYNMKYSQYGFSVRGLYRTARTLFFNQPLSALNLFASAAAGAYLAAFFTRGEEHAERGRSSGRARNALREWEPHGLFWAAVFIALPLEWALVSTSGRAFGHYFVTILPVVSASSAFLVSKIPAMFRSGREKNSSAAAVLMMALLLGSVWGVEVAVKGFFSPDLLRYTASNWFTEDYDRGVLVDYIRENTGEGDQVYLWDDHPEKLFLAERSSPASVLYATQLLLPGIDHAAAFRQLLSELEERPPALIIMQVDAGVGVPYLGSSDEDICRSIPTDACPGVLQLKGFVEQYYFPAAELGSWRIFELGPG